MGMNHKQISDEAKLLDASDATHRAKVTLAVNLVMGYTNMKPGDTFFDDLYNAFRSVASVAIVVSDRFDEIPRPA